MSESSAARRLADAMKADTLDLSLVSSCLGECLKEAALVGDRESALLIAQMFLYLTLAQAVRILRTPGASGLRAAAAAAEAVSQWRQSVRAWDGESARGPAIAEATLELETQSGKLLDESAAQGSLLRIAEAIRADWCVSAAAENLRRNGVPDLPGMSYAEPDKSPEGTPLVAAAMDLVRPSGLAQAATLMLLANNRLGLSAGGATRILKLDERGKMVVDERGKALSGVVEVHLGRAEGRILVEIAQGENPSHTHYHPSKRRRLQESLALAASGIGLDGKAINVLVISSSNNAPGQVLLSGLRLSLSDELVLHLKVSRGQEPPKPH